MIDHHAMVLLISASVAVITLILLIAVCKLNPFIVLFLTSLALAMATAAVIMMLSSLVDYPLRTPLLSALFALACVELVRAKRHADAPRGQ